MYHGLDKLSKRYYHLSEYDLSGEILNPRVPKNFLTELGFEENKTPRISFAKSISGALVGMSRNLQGKVLYIHDRWANQ